MSFRDYYISELEDMGIKTNREGKPIEQLDKYELNRLLAIERYKQVDVECDSAKMF